MLDRSDCISTEIEQNLPLFQSFKRSAGKPFKCSARKLESPGAQLCSYLIDTRKMQKLLVCAWLFRGVFFGCTQAFMPAMAEPLRIRALNSPACVFL